MELCTDCLALVQMMDNYWLNSKLSGIVNIVSNDFFSYYKFNHFKLIRLIYKIQAREIEKYFGNNY